MCRLLAYSGPPLPAADLMVAPPHSLVVQSYSPREMTSGTVNADGYGLAWYETSVRPEPFVYRTVLPIWNDVNLADIAGYVRSGRLLANVRSATPGHSMDFSNTQPFVFGRVTGIHNGFVDGFRNGALRRLRARLEALGGPEPAGTTDSEYLFAWIATQVERKGLVDGTATALRELPELVGDARTTLNFIVSDGESIVATRHALNTDSPTLYALERHERYPDGVVVASEPLFADTGWRALDPHSMIVVDPAQRTVRNAL